jgi:hypothetical protein
MMKEVVICIFFAKVRTSEISINFSTEKSSIKGRTSFNRFENFRFFSGSPIIFFRTSAVS